MQDSLERRGEVLIDGARVTPTAKVGGLGLEESTHKFAVDKRTVSTEMLT